MLTYSEARAEALSIPALPVDDQFAARADLADRIEATLTARGAQLKAARMAAGHMTTYPREDNHGLSTSAFDGDAAWNCIWASDALGAWKKAEAQREAA